jgi:hypothetical protein
VSGNARESSQTVRRPSMVAVALVHWDSGGLCERSTRGGTDLEKPTDHLGGRRLHTHTHSSEDEETPVSECPRRNFSNSCQE